MSSLKHCFHADKSSPASHYVLKADERFKFFKMFLGLCREEKGWGGSSRTLGPEIVFKEDSFLNFLSRCSETSLSQYCFNSELKIEVGLILFFCLQKGFS